LQSTTQKRSFSLVAKAGVAAAARPQIVRPVVNVSDNERSEVWSGRSRKLS
jgi:hypothetical protein